MAITRMGHIKDAGKGTAGVTRVIRYITNPVKCSYPGSGKLIGLHNIVVGEGEAADAAIKQIINTKKHYDKTDGRQMYHYKISFAEADKVTPEMAMKIAKEFCETYLADYEAVYAVHTNTKHLHFHVAFNSVSFVTGLKYHYANGDWRKSIQPVVNDICRRYGLSEIDVNTRGQKTNKSYNQWIMDHPEMVHTEKKEYSYARIRADLDACILKAKDYKDFLQILKDRGYGVDDSKKHLRIFAPGRSKAVRAYILTPDHVTYTKENIRLMIEGSFSKNKRREILERMYHDWNIFVGTKRTAVVLIKRHRNLSFARHEEAMRMILAQGFKGLEDVMEYRRYLELADKELNVVKKYVRSHMEYFEEFEEDVHAVLDYLELKDPKEKIRACEAMDRLADAGVDAARLSRLYEKSAFLMHRIDDFKKKLFVDKKMTERIILEEHRRLKRQKQEALAASEEKKPEYERSSQEKAEKKGGVSHE